VNATPGECLVFEDSWNGMTAAARAGCRVVGLAHEVPDGVVSMVDLQGEISFEGVTAQTVGQWWTTLIDREEL
ncbi:MAG TPA: HAD family phosphatase, partial [Corynebacterium sp.]|nr:HAD family phosphatase [Corynebacterium sp.]